MNRQRGADFLALTRDLRPHLAQRIGDTLHRTFGERCIAKQFGLEVLPGKDPGEQTDGGAGVAAIDGSIRRFQFHAVAGDGKLDQTDAFNFLQRLHGGTESLHGMHGAKTILTGQEAVNDGCALRESGKHRGTVGDAFVTRDGDFGGNTFEFLRLEAGHDLQTAGRRSRRAYRDRRQRRGWCHESRQRSCRAPACPS